MNYKKKKFGKKKWIFLILTFNLSSVRAEEAPHPTPAFFLGKPCASVYFEGLYLNSAKTFTGLLSPKFGYCNAETGFETYITPRLGADSRTFIDSSDTIYEDNFLFLGAGVDYTKLLPGVRLTAQVGRSFDLNSKIKLGGFDFRTGWMTYHEKEWIPVKLRSEFYTEGFYIYRYRNFITNGQARMVYVIWKSSLERYKGLELAPYLNLVGNIDGSGYDYNRFAEAQYGLRLRHEPPVNVGLSLYGVRGHRFGTGSMSPNYNDFRVLVNGYFEFP